VDPRLLLYALYERRLLRSLAGRPLPRHVGVMCDGNRRWARGQGHADPSTWYDEGARRTKDLVRWCDEVGVEHVTLWLLSTDNLSRPAAEIDPLLRVIENLVMDFALDGNPWRLKMVGALDLLPGPTAAVLKTAEAKTLTRSGGAQVNIAVGYGGRQEITDAVRSLLHEHAAAGTPIGELAETIDADQIADHLYTRGQPDPDLLIRTSGELRLSGFMLWQSANSEYYFCDAYWPEFRRTDFLRALRSYADRHRRFGT
jgi:short-chain Z-isoprenyl diphosphate synthase